MLDYRISIPWPVLQKHLAQQLLGIDSKLRHASDADILRLQGRSQQLEELLNLPETLKLLEEQNEEAAKQTKETKANG